MTNPTWPIGPARTRDGREARIYATDGGKGKPLHGALPTSEGWREISWTEEGRISPGIDSRGDLLHPKLTRDEAIAECLRLYYQGPKIVPSMSAMADVYDYVLKLKAEGRVDG